MRKTTITLLLAASFSFANAQLTRPPDGGNKKAVVGEMIGITDVTIEYNRPGVKGREGKIWGELVHTGFIDQGFGDSKSAPWRAGANENTVISFSTPVKIEGKEVPAGKYGLFIAYDPAQCLVILSKNYTSWGSYYYKESEDAVRVPVKPITTTNTVEWLKFEFINQENTAATLALMWEKIMIPFRIETDYINLQLESFRRELRSDKGFTWNSFNDAAMFTLQNNVNLEEGLQWAEAAISAPFIGQKNFNTLSTKAMLLNKLNRNAEADSVMKQAIPLANVVQLHGYGRQLLAQKRTKEAFNVFKMNYDKNPNEYTTLVGMTRGYSAMGDYKKALGFAEKALAKAPSPQEKTNIENLVKMLKEGKDVNQ